MSTPPAEIWLFRILHVSNVAYALRHGLFANGHPQQDPDYLFIGDTLLIAARRDYPVPLAGYGNLGDYVPFYFWPWSPMLLNIKTGRRGITQRPQRDIVYLCCRLTDVVAAEQRILFTDGHAKAQTSRFFTNLADLRQLDWEVVKLRYWPDVEDTDRQRRKQAECLVWQHVPPECISRVVVFDEAQRSFVAARQQEAGHAATLHVEPRKFYFVE